MTSPTPARPTPRPHRPGRLNLVLDTESGTGLRTTARTRRRCRAVDLKLVIRHLRIPNSDTLASSTDFIRVVILGLELSQKDWIEPGQTYTCRGRDNLW